MLGADFEPTASAPVGRGSEAVGVESRAGRKAAHTPGMPEGDSIAWTAFPNNVPVRDAPWKRVPTANAVRRH